MRATHVWSTMAYVGGGGTARLGLRERKKRATRQTLSWAALQLAVERGFDNVRVEDIAARAGVAPRTYNNYFSSKEEAICDLGVERAERVATALRDRPVDEPLSEAISHAMVQEYVGGGEPNKEQATRFRVVASTAALRGEYLKTVVAIERPLAEAIALRSDTDPERDLYPRVLAAAVASAARVASEHWLDPASSSPLATVLRKALAQVAAGFASSRLEERA